MADGSELSPEKLRHILELSSSAGRKTGLGGLTKPPVVAPEEGGTQADTLTLPWMPVPKSDFVVVVDGEQQEVVRVCGAHPAAATTLHLVLAAPWLLVVAERLRRAFEHASTKDGKTGVTLRQWVRNHEGANYLDELRHALGIAHGAIAPDRAVPASYGLDAPEQIPATPLGDEPEVSTQTMGGENGSEAVEAEGEEGSHVEDLRGASDGGDPVPGECGEAEAGVGNRPG